MALRDNVAGSLGKSRGSTALIGAAAVMLAPIMVPAVLAGRRPLSKMVIKGNVLVDDRAREGIAETGVQLSDLVVEARSELAVSAAAATAAQTASAAS